MSCKLVVAQTKLRVRSDAEVEVAGKDCVTRTTMKVSPCTYNARDQTVSCANKLSFILQIHTPR